MVLYKTIDVDLPVRRCITGVRSGRHWLFGSVVESAA